MESIPVNHPARVDLGIKLAGLVQGNTKFASDMDTAKVTQAATQSNAAATTKNADTNAVQAKTQQQQADTQTFNSRQAAYENAQKFGAVINEKLANHNKGIIGSPEGQEAYTKNLSEVIADKDKREKYMGVVAQAMSKNPLFAKLPTDEVVRVATQEVNNLGVGFWNAFNPLTDMSSTVRDRIVGELGKSLEANKDRIGKSELAFSKLLTQSELHKGVIEDTYRAAFPTGGAALDAQIAARQARVAAGAASAPGSPAPGAPQPPVVVPPKVDVPTSTKPEVNNEALKVQAQIEQKLISLGALDKHSPEVQKLLNGNDAEGEARRKAGAKWYQDQAMAQARNAGNPMLGTAMPPEIRAKEVQDLKDQLKELTKKAK
jgi:predicted phage tail protein